MIEHVLVTPSRRSRTNLACSPSPAVEEVSNLLMRLNLATRHYHAAVDEPWLDLLRPSVGLSDYVGVLVRTYGLVAPFESACKYTPGLAHVIDVSELIRAGLIAQDLLALGLTPVRVANVPTCPAIASFSGLHEALGWMYVVERSTLLQDGIRRHLVRQLPQVERACAYLGAYEGHVADHWTSFGRLLDRVTNDTAVANAVIRAACDAFDTCRNWLRPAEST